MAEASRSFGKIIPKRRMFWIEKPVNRHFKLAVLFENLDNAGETVIFLKIVKNFVE